MKARPRVLRRRIGIDLGGTKIEGVVLDANNQPLWRHRIPTESQRGYEHIVGGVVEMARACLQQAPQCTTVGIGTPGAVTRAGTMKNCNTTCLNGQSLPRDIAECLGLTVVVENDANCFALAEALAGAGRTAEMVFGVILGTGVGGGLVHCGELWHGPQHIAGEWGHHSIDPRGPLCYCGRRGCVERFIAGPALAEQYRERTGKVADAAAIVSACRAGEAPAMDVLHTFLDRFGRALANVISILDPDVVVLGGGLANVEELYTLGREAVGRYVFNEELLTPLRRNQLGDSAGVIGAAMLT